MRRIGIPIILALLLTACASQGDTSKAIGACYQGVTTANNLATTALQQSRISIEQACHVSVWGKLARAGCDAGMESWVNGYPETAEAQLNAAMLALNGFTEDAAVISTYTCGQEEVN